jgi:hypothetical protein
MRAWLLLPLVSAVIVAEQDAATTQLDASTIVVRVVDATSGEPVPGVTVVLSGPSTRRATTDSSGTLALGAGTGDRYGPLSGGKYRVVAEKTGYIEGTSGRRQPFGLGSSFDVAAGERADLTIEVWREAIVAGTVRYEDGRPVGPADGLVQAFNVSPFARYVRYEGRSDATGHYEIHNLPPGDYVIALPLSRSTARVSPPSEYGSLASVRPVGVPIGMFRFGVIPLPFGPDGESRTYREQFFPGTPRTAGAIVFHLEPGERRDDVDFRLTIGRAVTVSGRLIGSSGPAAHALLALTPLAESPNDAVGGVQAMFEVGGRFIFADVLPGRYLLKARELDAAEINSPVRIPPRYRVLTTLAVDVGERDITDLEVRLTPPVRVRGRVVYEGTTSKPDQTLVFLNQVGRGGNVGLDSPLAMVESAEFTIEIEPGRYILNAFGQNKGSWFGDESTWFIKSAFLGTRDVTLQPFEVGSTDVNGLVVTLADRPAVITGTALSPDGRRWTGATVVAFPADRSAWTEVQAANFRFGAVRALSGSFSFTTLPPGGYYVAATDARTPEEWGRALFTRLAIDATRVDIRNGEERHVDLIVR